MGKKGAIATILLFMIVVDVASASWNFRKLVSSEKKEKSHETVSPSPAPVSDNGTSKDKAALPPHKTVKNPPHETVKNVDGGEKKDETSANGPSGSNEKCDLTKEHCNVTPMVACVKAVDSVKKVIVVLIQNDGESNLNVIIRTSSVKNLKDGFEVPKHHSVKAKISLNDAVTQIFLNAGQGDCTLQIGKTPAKGDLPDWFPSYDDMMTPTYGAYLLILLSIIGLGVFACCKLRKRRQDEIPYVELEMGGMREETSVNVETAEGWDQGWDDDWDDNKAVKSPVVHHPGSVSSNGLTARSPNRDGWEDWDD